MTKQEMIEIISNIKNPSKEITDIYKVLDELGIKYEKTKCPRCRRDLFNICKEELGLIENAAEESDFNCEYEWKYIRSNGTIWKGVLFDQNTSPEMIEKFVKKFPKGYYKKVEKPQQEEKINNAELNNKENDSILTKE